MTTEELRELLVPTHIYYDAGTKSLKGRAFGEIITKCLFLLPSKKATFFEIKDLVAKFVGMPNLADKDMKSGFEFLKNEQVISKQGKYWFLAKETTERIEKDLINAEGRIKHILDKYFGTKINRLLLEKWFKFSVAAFYGKFGEVFSKRLKRQSVALPSEDSLLSVIEKPISDLNLEKHKDILRAGFQAFIKDVDDPITNQQIWSFAQAMLSAKLVNASFGPDPISINEFRNTKLLLDTNVLFVATLEKSRLSSALSSLASSINTIGSTLYITYETREEYRRVVARRKERVMRAINELPLDIIKDTKDSFVKTAISRGCVTKDSFETFFDSIADVPATIASEKINIEDSPEVKKASDEAAKDKNKKEEIAKEWFRIHHYSKSQNSIVHDSSLDGVADFLKGKGENIKVITADASMQNVSIKWSGSSIPTWVGLDTLIQLLAVSGVGPSHKPENFAPLLNSVIINDICANDKIFTIEDLDGVLDLDERVKELSKEEIENFATKIFKLRMIGKSKNDSELQLEIRRTFQRKKMNYDENAQKLENRAQNAEQYFHVEQKRTASLETYLSKKTYKGELVKSYLLYGFLTSLCILFGVVIIFIGYNIRQTHNQLAWFLISFGAIEIILSTFKWIIPKLKEIPVIAKENADNIVKRLKDEI